MAVNECNLSIIVLKIHTAANLKTISKKGRLTTVKAFPASFLDMREWQAIRACSNNKVIIWEK